MGKDLPIILPESDLAASKVTVTGWMSRDGRFYGDREDLARFDGSTHKKCESCGQVIERSRYCRPCADARDREKYRTMPRAPWDGEGVLYSRTYDDYTEDPEDFCDEKSEGEPVTFQDCDFELCSPERAWSLDPAEIYDGHLTEDREVSLELEEAFDRLNEAIKAMGDKAILSWSPNGTAWDGTYVEDPLP